MCDCLYDLTSDSLMPTHTAPLGPTRRPQTSLVLNGPQPYWNQPVLSFLNTYTNDSLAMFLDGVVINPFLNDTEICSDGE